MSDLISVIVPVYNVEKYLKRCLDSIVFQTYRDLEIILINDGSTDKSQNICEEYRKKDDRIVLINKSNSGAGESRNAGLDIARGEYIAFVDSDDYIARDFINTLYNSLKSTGTPLCATCFKETAPQDASTEEPFISSETIIFEKKEAIRNLFNDDFYGNFLWNKLYHRSLFSDIRFKNNKLEDLDVMYHIFNKVSFISYNPSKMYFYTQRPDSQIHEKELKIFETKIMVTSERFEFIKKLYPDMIENYLDYAQTILECFPYILFRRNLRNKCKNDMKKIIPQIYDHLDQKSRLKLSLFGMKK